MGIIGEAWRSVKPYLVMVFLQLGYAGMFVVSVVICTKYTSASFSSALYNILPAVTFVSAIVLRMERVKIKERRSQAKIVGTLVTVIGAMIMILYKGPIDSTPDSSPAVYSGVMCSGVAYYLQGVVMKERGLVFVTAFNPLCMVIVAVMGSIILAEEISLGRVIGAVIIVIGLYALIRGMSSDRSTQPSEDGEMIPLNIKKYLKYYYGLDICHQIFEVKY
uniref:WAT1-related protein n=1 Tax=Musa acuminata subsp. malaccensis TaxID=214687 RepID=A0A804KY24_MUSAM